MFRLFERKDFLFKKKRRGGEKVKLQKKVKGFLFVFKMTHVEFQLAYKNLRILNGTESKHWLLNDELND